MMKEEWIEECVGILTTAPFKWPESKSKIYAEGLLSFFGADSDPRELIEEDRQYWEPAA